jgi:hypothetical protein
MGTVKTPRRDETEQLAHAVSVNVGVVRHQNQFVRDGVQGGQHIETLPPRGCPDEVTRETPKHSEVWR